MLTVLKENAVLLGFLAIGIALLFVDVVFHSGIARFFGQVIVFTIVVALIRWAFGLGAKKGDSLTARGGYWRGFVRTWFGPAAGDRFDASIRRTEEREQEAARRDVTLIDILEEEHARSKS